MTGPAVAANAYALVIGMGAIDSAHYRDSHLKGFDGKNPTCEKDARDVAEFASKKSFRLLGDGPLLTENATHAEVSRLVNRAARELEAGDIFFLYFSGHGGSLPRSDDAEEEGEYWALYDDVLWDDEWDELLTLFKRDVRVLVISDSCNAGGFGPPDELDPDEIVFETDALLKKCGFPRDPRPRKVPAGVTEYLISTGRGRIAHATAPGGILPQRAATVLLLAACQANQDAYTGEKNGMFTQRLLDVANKRPQATYRQLLTAVGKRFCPLQSPLYYSAGSLADAFGDQTAFSTEPIGATV